MAIPDASDCESFVVSKRARKQRFERELEGGTEDHHLEWRQFILISETPDGKKARRM